MKALERRVTRLEAARRDDTPRTIGATYTADGTIVHVAQPEPVTSGPADYRRFIWEQP